MSAPPAGSLVEIAITAIAHGGEGVGRVEGKAHFVPGVIPGEIVVGRVIKDGGSWARAELVEVRTPAEHRVTPPCRHAADCGGCQWQHAAYEAQLAWKHNTVISQLEHIGKLTDPPVAPIVAPGPPLGYRNRMDFKVSGDRPALNRPRSHELVPLTVCELLDPGLAEVFARLGDLRGTTRLTLRAGTFTGDRLAIVEGEVPAAAGSWGIPVAQQRGNRIAGIDGPDTISEMIGAARFRITGTAFFQNNSHGAAALADLVAAALEPDPADTLLDAYAGVGLFGVAMADRVGRVLAVESNRHAVADLRHNLAGSGVEHRVIAGKMEDVADKLDEYPGIVVADPPRAGLGEAGIAAITAALPRRVAYVSCDPASLARDAALLQGQGYELASVTPVDMFPQTFHIEAVACFVLG